MSSASEASLELWKIVGQARHLLLDFDGPVCDVYAGTSSRAVADALRAALADLPLATHVLSDDDPLEVLIAATAIGPQAGARAQRVFARLEVQAVSTAQPTAGAAALVATARKTKRSVAIVSNNSSQAISAYLAAHDLARHVQVVVGRDDPDPAKMKPNPHRVRQAIESVAADPAECVLIGDSTTDVIAAHAAGIRAIGYANRPGKADQLRLAGADAITDSMTVITQAASASANRADL